MENVRKTYANCTLPNFTLSWMLILYNNKKIYKAFALMYFSIRFIYVYFIILFYTFSDI